MVKTHVISQVTSQNRSDLLWSLQPNFYSMRIFAIELNGGPSKFRYYSFLVLRLAMVSYIFFSCYYVFIWSEWKYDPTTTRFWCSVLRRGTRFLSAVLFQLALIVITVWNWDSLRAKLETMEQFINSHIHFPTKLHRISMLLITVTLIMVKSYLFLFFFVWISSTLISSSTFFQEFPHVLDVYKQAMLEGFLISLSVIGNVMGHLSECFLVNFFVFLTCVASMSIQSIIQDVGKYLPPTEIEAYERVARWKRNYHSILGFIDEIDSVFGPALLILITKQFIMFVMWSFSIVISWARQESIYNYIVLIITDIVLMALLILGSQQMKNQASFTSRESGKKTFVNDIVHPPRVTGFKFGQSVKRPSVS